MPREEVMCFCPTCGEDVDPNPEGLCPRCGHIVMGGGVIGMRPVVPSAAPPPPNGKPTIADDLEALIGRCRAERANGMRGIERNRALVAQIDSLLGPLERALIAARGLLSTRGDQGRTVAPSTEAAEGKRWARDWDACRGCGTTERPHVGKGLCSTCQVYVRRGTPLPLEVAS